MQLPPSAGGQSYAWDLLQAEIAAGRIPLEAVEAALVLWQTRLAEGIGLPNGEIAFVTEISLFHVLADSRFWRAPHRIERLLLGIFEIRTGLYGRRRAISRWNEDEANLLGYAIIDEASIVRTLHIVRPSEFRRLLNVGEHLWP